MSNIIPFNNNAQLPAHLAEMFGDSATQENAALAGGVGPGFGVISYKGKDWALVIGGERHPMETASGDPATSIEVIIVKANDKLSKIYYATGYVEGSQEKPDCYSNDGVTPALDAAEPQCSTCAACPQNVWGSKISDNGSKVKACSDSRRMAVVFPNDLENPYLLRVPAASLKEVAKYGQMLSERRTPFQAVVTKISFDREVAHPQFVLKPTRFIDAEEAEAVRGFMDSEVIEQMVGLNAEPVHEGEIAVQEKPATTRTVTRPAPAAAAPAARPAATRTAPAQTRGAAAPRSRPAPAPEPDEGGEEPQIETPPAKPARAARAPRQAPAPAAAPQASEPAQRRAAAPAEDELSAAADAASAELDAVLAELDD